jgi:hypothetical protein
MQPTLIRPSDFKNYVDRWGKNEIIAWFNEIYVITEVLRPGLRSEGLYDLFSFTDRIATVNNDFSITIEAYDEAKMRQQCLDIVNKLGGRCLIIALQDLKAELDWQEQENG